MDHWKGNDGIYTVIENMANEICGDASCNS